MSYPNPDDKDLLKDIVHRKEFYQYYLPHVAEGEREVMRESLKFLLERLEEENIHLDLNSYQAMVSNFLSPSTPWSRLLLQWDPGMGKTIAAIDTAMRYIRLFERESQEEENFQGNVTIIGFTEDIFKRELLSFPKYGFINRDELRQLQALKDAAFQGNKTDQDRLQEFQIKLRKRLTSRHNNGYFRFFGYKAFVNRIFMLQDSTRNINEMSEEDIRKALKDGSLKWNKSLLDSFKNSLLICDEIHDVYNSLEKNNWGIAIQMVLDSQPSLKALFMSATPINNSPTEIVDLCNLLNPPSKRITKPQLFTKDGQLLPGSLDKISDLLRGKVSFVQDTNPEQFATQTIEGEEIEGIQYLKFIRSPMSKFHYHTYKEVYKGALSQDAQYLVDMALPNPLNPDLGLYKTTEIRKALSVGVDEKFYKTYGFRYQNDTIIGPGFDQDKIGQWSAKYATLLGMVKDLLKPNAGKLFIYHNVVHISGVLFIEQLLQQNGFISIDQSETKGTLCSVCGKMKEDHPAAAGGGGGDDKKDYKIVKYTDLTSEQKKELNYLEGKVFGYPRLETWATKTTWAAIKDNHVIGIVEYRIAKDSKKARLHTLIVKEDERKKGIGRELLRSTMPSFRPVDVWIYKLWSKGAYNKEWFSKLGWEFVDEDDQNWYFEWPEGYTIGGAKSEKTTDHAFVPARYIMAHSDMEKTVMQKNIDRFNAPDNTDGYLLKVIVGSKIIRQSYNFKAIRYMFIVGRPDNISILLQILGRGRRRGSHAKLPPHLRKIVVYILTSCLPIKDSKGRYLLSHEETKYKEKIEDYLVIQQIEKVMHEVAIDGAISRPIIEPSLDQKNRTLGALWYEPVVEPKRFALKDLNLSTFDAFHNDNELNQIIYVIKRLFIEVSLVWKFDDLWAAVRDPPFKMQVNTGLFSIDNFIIALDMLVFKGLTGHWVQPLQHANGGENPDQLFLLDLLHNTVDKRLIMPDKSIGYIHYLDQYYIFIPMRGQSHVLNIESPFRVPQAGITKPINILRYIKDVSGTVSYDNRKLKFWNSYQKVPLEKLATAISKFGPQFHSQFVEEIIKYVFQVWTSPALVKKSEYHDFYFKMLYFYDLMGMVVWASTAKEYIRKMYASYLLTGPEAKRQAKILNKDDSIVESLSKSLSHSSAHMAESLKASKQELFSSLKLSTQVMSSKEGKKAPKTLKTSPHLLPLGHFMAHVPKFYHPEKEWFESPEYVQRTQEYKENDIIIGYYEKSPTGLRIKFKIRNPIHLIKKHKDIRMIEKGSICTSNSKAYLVDIASKLGIHVLDKINVPNLCSEIESRLILNELNERKKKTNIKWFYSFWETRPDEKRTAVSVSSSS